MVRSLLILVAALVGALAIAFLASQPPRPLPASASPSLFSAERAMADVREIARSPRPTGSARNVRVRAYLTERMRQLGMTVETQSGPLPPKSAERLAKWGDPDASRRTIANLIGVLPGRDSSKPALLLMAHHDSVWASPGAADDAAGVAAALEIVRAISASGRPDRDVAILLTDAEEIGLDGARLFFAAHPLAGRVGAVINMESRGGGGRTSMFETGRGNEHWIDVYRRSVARPFSNSLGVLIYELMPNNTDFTIPKKLGVPGFNFAFIGNAAHYHSPMSTTEALDRGSLQDTGDQALSVARALAFARELPSGGENAVFGDVLGLFVIAYAPWAGWWILGVITCLLGFSCWRLRKAGQADWRTLLGGFAISLSLLLHCALLLRIINLVSGSGGPTNYYDRLAALSRLEFSALLSCLAVLLLASVVAARGGARLWAAAPALFLMVAGVALGGWSAAVLALGIGAAVAATLLPREQTNVWAGWLGLILVILLAGLAVQVVAPTAGPVLQWPLVLAAAGAAFAAWRDPRLEQPWSLAAIAFLAVLGVGQLLYLAHFTFLGVGAGMPEIMAAFTLLSALLLWPLLWSAAAPRWYAFAALALVLVSTGTALSVRLDQTAETIPPYSERR